MFNTKHFVKINPAAEVDIVKMNEILQADKDYIKDVEFTHSEVVENDSVQFFYNHPEEFTPEQATKAQLLVKKVYTDFMASRIVTGQTNSGL